MENYEDIVGPKPEDREQIIEDVTADGQPLYMAFLADPEAPHISHEEVEAAKNALQRAKSEQAEVIKMCQRKPLNECIEDIHKLAA